MKESGGSRRQHPEPLTVNVPLFTEGEGVVLVSLPTYSSVHGVWIPFVVVPTTRVIGTLWLIEPFVPVTVTVYGPGGVEEMVRRRDEVVPMGKMGDAWDVAYASLFLASDEAKYITGAMLVVDGGLTCKFS